jgi:hypothetical protein
VLDDESDVVVVLPELEPALPDEDEDAPPLTPEPPDPGELASAGGARNSNTTATTAAPVQRTPETATVCDTQNPFSFVRLRG